MCMQLPSKGPRPVGSPCPETGGKIGKAALASMAKASPLKSPPVTAALSPPSTWRLLIGPLARPTLVHNSHDMI